MRIFIKFSWILNIVLAVNLEQLDVLLVKKDVEGCKTFILNNWKDLDFTGISNFIISSCCWINDAGLLKLVLSHPTINPENTDELPTYTTVVYDRLLSLIVLLRDGRFDYSPLYDLNSELAVGIILLLKNIDMDDLICKKLKYDQLDNARLSDFQIDVLKTITKDHDSIRLMFQEQLKRAQISRILLPVIADLEMVYAKEDSPLSLWQIRRTQEVFTILRRVFISDVALKILKYTIIVESKDRDTNIMLPTKFKILPFVKYPIFLTLASTTIALLVFLFTCLICCICGIPS